MPQQYLSTDPNAGKPAAPTSGGYLSTDASAGKPGASIGPGGPLQPPARSWLDSLKDFGGELQSLNPKAVIGGLVQMAGDIPGTISAVGQAQGDLEKKAEAAFKRGDYAQGVRHALHYLLPLIGPRLDQAADHMQKGEIAKGLGATADVGVQVAAPQLAQKLPAVARPFFQNRNPAEAEAAAWGAKQGVPVDAATATGNPFIRGVQKLADQSLGGSVVGGKAQANQAGAMTRVGNQLADRVHPSAVTAEQAGQAVRDGVMGSLQREAGAANVAYDALRAFEKQKGWIPVDITRAKAGFQPVYKALMRERELNGVMMGDKARALNALDKIMNADDVLSLSEIDPILSDLKSFARTDVPELRSVGQGTAAQMVKVLDGEVRLSAQRAGPQAIRALEDGRKATIAKYGAADVLDTLNAEPVRTMQGLTAPKDSALQKLRAVARESPQSIPQIGRAVLDGFLDKATEAGGFAHADKLYADWMKLGDGTKLLLYKNPGYVKELDNFFLLAKKMAENPNPSGTALTAAKGGELSLWLANPAAGAATSISATALSKLLHSPTGVRLLTKGLRLPSGNTAATATYAAELSRAIDGLVTTARVPALAGEEGRRR